MTGLISVASGLAAVPPDASVLTGTVGISQGGTGQTTAAAALTALGAGGGSTILTPTISGGTISGATIVGETVSGGTLSGPTINSATISGGTLANAINANTATFSGGTYSSPTLTGGTSFALVQSSVTFTTRVITAAGAVTINASDYRLVLNKTTGAATTVTLPVSPVQGRTIVVKDGKGDANSNNISIIAASGTIDGTTTSTINAAYGAKTLGYSGTEWGVE